jgi:hypothetical protein
MPLSELRLIAIKRFVLDFECLLLFKKILIKADIFSISAIFTISHFNMNSQPVQIFFPSFSAFILLADTGLEFVEIWYDIMLLNTCTCCAATGTGVSSCYLFPVIFSQYYSLKAKIKAKIFLPHV